LLLTAQVLVLFSWAYLKNINYTMPFFAQSHLASFRAQLAFQRPPKKRWNQHRHNTFFTSFLAITLMLVVVPLLVALQVRNGHLDGGDRLASDPIH